MDTKNRIAIYVILFSTFLFAFTQFLLINAYPTIMREFHINNSQIQLLTSLFLFSTLVLIPFTHHMSYKFQSNHLIIVSLLLLFIGTLLGSMSSNFYMLLIARVIQGVGYAIILPIAQSILMKIAPNNQQAFILGVLNSVINIAPAIAPPLTGLFLELWNWRFIYKILLPLELLTIGLSLVYLKNVFFKKSVALNGYTVGIYTLGSLFLLIAFLSLDTNSLICLVCSLMSIIIFIFFIRNDKKSASPLLDFSLLNSNLLKLSTLSLFLIMMLLLSVESILPILTQSVLHYSPIESGIIMTPGTIMLIVSTSVSSKLFDRWRNINIIIIGMIITIISLILFILITNGTNIYTLMIIFCLFMFGMGLSITPLTTIAFNTLDNNSLFQGSSLINTFRQLGLILGVTLFSKIIIFISSLDLYDRGLDNLSFGIRVSYIIMLILSLVILKTIYTTKRA